MHRRHRHDALVGILEVQARFLRLHSPGLEQKNAGDDLKTVGNAVLHLLKQNFLCLKQLVLFTISLAAQSYVLNGQKNGSGYGELEGIERHRKVSATNEADESIYGSKDLFHSLSL